MSTILSISNVSKSYGAQTILKDVSLVLGDRQRVGLVGSNGVGKSTLLKIVMGEIEADSGTVTFAPGVRVGYLAQVIANHEGKTIADLVDESQRHLHDCETRMHDLEAQMSHAAGDDLTPILQDYGDLSEQFERMGGYDVEHRADMVFAGLQIAHLDRSRLFTTLSGGEKSRVGLALLLLQAPDVLLLDEPTNHLDFASMAWLEEYLARYKGAVLIVSHDRRFLNRTVNAIIEIDEQARTTKHYTGDYDAYQRAKTIERRRWQAAYEEQCETTRALRIEIKETAHRNTNYRAHRDNDKYILHSKQETHAATVARRVQVAQEKLRRIEANPIPEPPDDLRFDPNFDPQALKGRAAVIVSHLSKSFGEHCLLRDVSFTLGIHSRIVLVGPNGAGKSTLLKLLLGQLMPDDGEVYVNPGVQVGYLDQENSTFEPSKTVFEVYSAEREASEQQLKTRLVRSGLFRYPDLERRVSELSSGQQRKLAIARLIAMRANLLVLDEPTNAVSFDVVEGLEAALREFPSAVIAASHDRRFIEQFNGEVWELRDGHIVPSAAEFSEYLAAASD
jgi:macrolide transport system ATP-binding/permease protein